MAKMVMISIKIITMSIILLFTSSATMIAIIITIIIQLKSLQIKEVIHSSLIIFPIYPSTT